jgi:cyclophilin family peptidyl-prolyl cis-trans isomerase
MSFVKSALLGLAILLATTLSVSAAEYLLMDLKQGRVVIQLRPDLAPKHVARIKELAEQGFYDGIIFHRVIDGFMAQTGDPTGTGRGGSGKTLPPEFTRTRFERGTVGMARGPSLSSADSQFFICFRSAPNLDGHYTVWGQVVKGMEFVDQIARGQPPRNPDRIIKMRVSQTADD